MNSETVKALRYYKGMTQQQLADATGFSQSLIAHVESGVKNVSPRLRHELLKLIGDDIGFFDALEKERQLLFFIRDFEETHVFPTK